MTRLLLVRIVLALAGVIVWQYGARVDRPDIRWIGVAILAIALLLRFAPKRWFGDDAR